MNVQIKKDHADWIARQVRDGRYASESEAVAEALATLIDDDEVARLRERPKDSLEQVERGQTVAADDAFYQRLHDQIDLIEASARK